MVGYMDMYGMCIVEYGHIHGCYDSVHGNVWVGTWWFMDGHMVVIMPYAAFVGDILAT